MDSQIFNNNEITQQLPIKINVIITEKQGMPCVELRRNTCEVDIMKLILSAAFRGEQLKILPVFSDEVRSIGSMIEKGIIYIDEEDQQYKYVI